MKGALRRQQGLGAIELIEQAVHLLRAAPAATWASYYLGALPFVLGLLYFWADMSRSSFAYQHLAGGALGAAALFLWMKVWQAVFARDLRALMAGEERPQLSWGECRQIFVSQTALQPAGLFLLPLSLIPVLPFAWVYAFFQNLTALAGGELGGLRASMKKAAGQAALWPRQNLILLALLSAFGGGVFLNWAIVSFILPGLVKMLFGVESVFSRSGLSLLNTTFFAAVLGLTYLCVDPILKAAYALRCFYGQSLRSGEDLKAELKQFITTARQVAALILLAGLVFARPGALPVNLSKARVSSRPMYCSTLRVFSLAPRRRSGERVGERGNEKRPRLSPALSGARSRLFGIPNGGEGERHRVHAGSGAQCAHNFRGDPPSEMLADGEDCGLPRERDVCAASRAYATALRPTFAKRLECAELAPALRQTGHRPRFESAGKPDALQTLRAVPDQRFSHEPSSSRVVLQLRRAAALQLIAPASLASASQVAPPQAAPISDHEPLVAVSPAPVSASQLDRAIQKVIRQRKYTWRMPREKILEPDTADRGIIGRFLERVRTMLRRWLRDLKDWLEEWLRRLFRRQRSGTGQGASGYGWILALHLLLYALVAAVAAALLLLLYRVWLNRRRGRATTVASQPLQPAPDLANENVGAEQLPEGRWMSLARELLERGELRLAVRAFYLASLAHLAGRNLLSLAKFKSNRDYERELRRRGHSFPDLLALFNENGVVFDRIWYGLHELNVELVRQFAANVDRIRIAQ